VYVVDADRLDVAPVAVIVFAPPVVSATTKVAEVVWHDPAPVIADPPGVVPVVQLVAPAKEPVVKAVVEKVIDSQEPKPVALMTEPARDCSGKPQFCVLVVAYEILGVIVYGTLTVVVPSLTTMV